MIAQIEERWRNHDEINEKGGSSEVNDKKKIKDEKNLHFNTLFFSRK